jgi:hypothetical protein
MRPSFCLRRAWRLSLQWAVFNPLGVAFAAGAGGAIGEVDGLPGWLQRTGHCGKYKNLQSHPSVGKEIWSMGYFGIISISQSIFRYGRNCGRHCSNSNLAVHAGFCWVGQTIKMALFAYAGAYSIDWIASFLRIDYFM